MSADLNWYGDAAEEYIRKRAVMALRRACIEITRRAKQLLSVSGTGVRTTQGTVIPKVKGGPRGGTTVYGAFPSAPGEPPHKQTGFLRESVTYEIDEPSLTARVGSNAEYAKPLELGTSKMKPRPWLRRAAYETKDQIDLHLSEG